MFELGLFRAEASVTLTKGYCKAKAPTGRMICPGAFFCPVYGNDPYRHSKNFGTKLGEAFKVGRTGP